MRIQLLPAVVCSVALLSGCATRPAAPVAVAPPPPVSQLPVTAFAGSIGSEIPLRTDPALAIIAQAEAAFDLGEDELAAGRLVAAREHFDRAVDQLLGLPTGARSDVAVASAFDSLLDRISALEIQALRDGDGLAEAATEPAALDELLGATMFELPQPALTTAETVEAELSRGDYSIGIPANARVLSFVELLQGRLRDYLAAGLDRSMRYMPMVKRVFAEEGVPAELVYVPLIESAFKPNALSRARARGLWQFMPATGLEHGLRQNWFIDERSDPEKSTRAAARYLKTLSQMFDGDWSLALASYNGGPGRVQRAMKASRKTDFWSLTATTRYLPRETRDYVPMVMAATLIARNPQLFGFDSPGGHPLSYETVHVANALDLKYLAEWAAVPVEELRDLNPDLRRTTTPMGGHHVKVPVGTAAAIERQLVAAEPLYAHFTLHTVRKGETLSSIARRYRVPLTELRAANELTTRSRVRVSQSLMIPQRATPALPVAASRTAAATVTRASAPRPATGAQSTYRVVRGDTLYSIARRFETTVDAIKRLNRLTSNTINIGDRLTVR
jgi:membrane-bound lytic murein transglycosylase D